MAVDGTHIAVPSSVTQHGNSCFVLLSNATVTARETMHANFSVIFRLYSLRRPEKLRQRLKTLFDFSIPVLPGPHVQLRETHARVPSPLLIRRWLGPRVSIECYSHSVLKGMS